MNSGIEMDDNDYPSSNCIQSFSLHRLLQEQVAACCILEADCFNELRKVWNQPLQWPRRADWLNFHVRRYPKNCVVALSGDNVVGFCMVHTWGSLGWLGPVVVDHKFQGQGLGKMLVRWALERMKIAGCNTLGLETWPNHVHNIGLYLKEGFLPGPLTVVLEKPVKLKTVPFFGERISKFLEQSELLADLAVLSGSIVPGLNYRPMLEALTECNMGEAFIWKVGGRIIASACLRWQAYTQIPDPSYAVLEMLTVKPGEENKLKEILTDIEGLVAEAGRSSLLVQFSSQYGSGLLTLVNELGYGLVKTRLRMYASRMSMQTEMLNFSSLAV